MQLVKAVYFEGIFFKQVPFTHEMTSSIYDVTHDVMTQLVSKWDLFEKNAFKIHGFH